MRWSPFRVAASKIESWVASERGREWPTSKGVAADEEYSGADERGREWRRERERE
jgi:hypothetical protein